jgi:hypothetical protein
MRHKKALVLKSEPSEPPARSPLLFIGRNRRGCWVARDQSGLRGGLFVNQAQAFRFALSENGGRPQAIVLVSGPLELDMSGSEKFAANDAMAGPIAALRAGFDRSSGLMVIMPNRNSSP